MIKKFKAVLSNSILNSLIVLVSFVGLALAHEERYLFFSVTLFILYAFGKHDE